MTVQETSPASLVSLINSDIDITDYIIDMEVSWGEANRAEGYLSSERFSGLPGTYTRIGSLCGRCCELERMRNV